MPETNIQTALTRDGGQPLGYLSPLSGHVGWFVTLRTYGNGNRTYYCRYSTNRNGNTTMGIGHITAVIVLTGNTTMGIGH